MANRIKRLAVLGSTGSIGRQTLDVVRALPGRFGIVALAAGENLNLLAEQVAEFRPEFICYSSASQKGKAALKDAGCAFLPLEAMASHPDTDIVVIATAGMAGLKPTMAAVKAGKNIALANKESLVAAGEMIMAEAKRSGARLLPVDSEHSAIWQCLRGEGKKARRLILTASGGPFREYPRSRMKDITAAQALNHPSWRMGKKVTIDSATLMNKGLEIIEARWLFRMPFARIKVVIHPQSIVHSMVEFADGSVKAQLSCPDMRLPIQYALTYPERLANPQLPILDWDSLRSLTFEPPDLDKFPCLKLAIEAGKEGGTAPAALCAADEATVELFLAGRIGFADIPRIIAGVLAKHRNTARPSIEEITAADTWAREAALNMAEKDKK